MNRYQTTFISVLMLVIFSCDKNEIDERTNIFGKWEVISFMSVESVAYPKKDGFNPEIEFKTSGSYLLKLDLNSCQGNFNLFNGKSISFSASGCTKMCCDSEFSQKFAEILPQVRSYQIENDKLKLEIPEWGWINLELNN